MSSAYVLFSYFSLFIFGLVDNSRGPIYPKVIEVFELSNSASSWIFTVSSLVSFFMALGIPLWISRFGAIRSSKAAMVFHILALGCMGFSGLTGKSYGIFLLGSVFLGLAMGIQSVTVNLIISKVSSLENASRLFSGLHSMYGLASLIGPFILGAVFRLGASWQWCLIFIALLPLIHLIAFRDLAPLGISAKAGQEEKASATKSLDSKFEWKNTIRLGGIFSFYIATEILVSSRLVFFFYSEGIDLEKASYGLTVFFLFLLLGRVGFSFFTPNIKPLNLLRISVCLTLSFYLLSLLVHPYWLCLSGASISYFFPCGLNYIKNENKEPESVISKVMMFVGAMLAGMHFFFGFVSDLYGIQAAMWLGVLFLCIVFLLLFTERSKRAI